MIKAHVLRKLKVTDSRSSIIQDLTRSFHSVPGCLRFSVCRSCEFNPQASSKTTLKSPIRAIYDDLFPGKHLFPSTDTSE